MTEKIKYTLVAALCIFSVGLIGSYRNFQSFQIFQTQLKQEQNSEIVQWVAQNVEQKIIQLESSVSYLDKSTVESLQRLGARYFAYAFLKKGEWSVKWKLLGDTSKEMVKSEVENLDFAKLDEKRQWKISADGQLMLIAPVSLAQTHQLKDGYLIFGLNSQFFSGLSAVDKDVFVLSPEKKSLHNKWSNKTKNFADLFDIKTGKIGTMSFDLDQEQEFLASYLSPLSRLYFVRQSRSPLVTYAASPQFNNFLIYSFLGLLLFMGLSFIGLSRSLFRLRVLFPLNSFFSKTESVEDEDSGMQSLGLTEVPEEALRSLDFGDFLTDILEPEYGRLRQLDIQLKTHIQEGVQVEIRPNQIRNFVHRLIGNSVEALEGGEEKTIEIQVVEQSQSYQLIYLDTRDKQLPGPRQKQESGQPLEQDSSIDSLIAYGDWVFGDAMTVAKKGFCLSVDLQRPADSINPVVQEALVERLERIEITDQDTDQGIFNQLSLPNKDEEVVVAETPKDPESEVQFDDFMEHFSKLSLKKNSSETNDEEPLVQFQMSDLSFADSQPEASSEQDSEFYEFETNDFKLKIRPPMQKDENDSSESL